ncbi:MAG: hypothetical protein KF754_11715 [Planctomycetes bacterium]|nr:hypothetical protein [Planctomycetota bacterium]
MMNPWDRERMWRESEPNNQPRGFASGLAWLVAIVLGVLGMMAMAKHGFRTVAVIPIGISLFFIFMFMIGHRREQRRLMSNRWQQMATTVLPQPPLQEIRLEQQSLPKADDASLRKLYDRFDVKAIEECRHNSLDAGKVTEFLEMSRDFMDTAHAAQLIRRNDLAELQIHMHAALERAKLQFELNNPGAFKAPPKIEEPPF